MRIIFEDDLSDIKTEHDDIATVVTEPPSDASESSVNMGPIASSETSKTETDEDWTYSDTSTKKRKKLYTLRSGNKKLRTSERIKNLETKATRVPNAACSKKSPQQTQPDTKSLETMHTRILEHTHNPIVYTTKLEDMAILQKNIKHYTNAYLLKKIMWESKPVYIARRKSRIVKKTISFELLTNTLKKLSKTKRTDVVRTRMTPNNRRDNNMMLNSYLNKKKSNVTFNAKEKVVLDISQKFNLIIVIKNLFSKTYDTYVTDAKGNITDYYFAKSNDIIGHTDQSKFRLTLVMCCWFNRQHRIESIWPRHTYPFSRFLTTTHKCPPDRCTCCCKPQEKRSNELVLCKPCDSEVFSDCLMCSSNRSDENLILTALKYKPPEANKIHYTHFNETTLSASRFVFSEKIFVAQNKIPKIRSELYEMRNNEIVRFHVDAHMKEGVSCSRCINMLAMTGFISHKLLVCCQWKRDCFLDEEYKKGYISSSILRFLKKTVSPYMCGICKDNLRPETNVNCKILNANLDINIPRVVHTRKLVKPTLLKIGYKSTIETPIQVSTVTINVHCEQIPELVFELCNLNIQVAKKIVEKFKQMSLAVKSDGKVIASLNSSIQTTSTEEFKIFALILKNIQNHPKLASISPGSNINLAIKIVYVHQSDLQTDVASDGGNLAENEPYKFGSILEKTLKQGSYNKPNRQLNSKRSDNYNISQQTSLKNVTIEKTFPNDFNTVFKTVEELDIPSNKLEAFDNFSNLIKRSKKCFGDSFKAYVNDIQHTENETEMVIPKITSVFSLQDSTLNSSAETSVTNLYPDSKTSIPSNIYNNNSNFQKDMVVRPALNMPQIGQKLLIYNARTKRAQLINFIPYSCPSISGSLVNNSLTNTPDNSKNTTMSKPVDLTNSSLAVLTPMFLSPTLVPIQARSTLPDIVNDIIKNNCAPDRTNHTVVREEVDEEVVLLDSE